MTGTALSEHVRLEIANAVHRGHWPGDPPPLDDGEPVPGCGCPICTGIAADNPARRIRRRNRPNQLLPVEDARRVPILEVAQRLGLGEPISRGGEVAVRCPLHDDERPSLTIDPDRNVWYCFPCGMGGDGIGLYRLATGLSFGEVVRELAA